MLWSNDMTRLFYYEFLSYSDICFSITFALMEAIISRCSFSGFFSYKLKIQYRASISSFLITFFLSFFLNYLSYLSNLSITSLLRENCPKSLKFFTNLSTLKVKSIFSKEILYCYCSSLVSCLKVC